MAKDKVERKKKILNIIVREYIVTATPVASETMQRNYNLGVSSATIRNDMASLEEEGYITRPHTSAGCIPLDRGYRHYVESVALASELDLEEKERIKQLFDNTIDEVERYLKLAASLISKLVGNAAVVTFPKAEQIKYKHIELVSLHDFLALLVLVLSEAIIRKHFISFSTPVTQDELTVVANRFNANYYGLTRDAINANKMTLDDTERAVRDAIIHIMQEEDDAEQDEAYLEGLRLMLAQPEFLKHERTVRVLELLEGREWLRKLKSLIDTEDRVRVIIGSESGSRDMQDLSFVFGTYGIPRRLGGSIGIIGPTRMDYRKAISSVSFISEILSRLMGEVCSD